MLSIGALIWVSVRPLLRLIICTSCGFIITKADIFPLVAARGTGQILLNITYPALMFSKIVPAFTSDNVGALGPLILVAIIYEALGICIAWFVKQFFWVPHRFRYGILVAGGWSNVGDVPTAVIMSITGSAPFNGTADQTVAVAYVAAFILVFFITLFPMGGHRLISWDYVGPEVDDDELRMGMPAKTRESVKRIARGAAGMRWRIVGDKGEKGESNSDVEVEKGEYECEGNGEKGTQKEMECAEEKGVENASSGDRDGLADLRLSSLRPSVRQKHVSFHGSYPDDGVSTAAPTAVCSPAHTEAGPSRFASPAPSVTHVDSEVAFSPNPTARRVQFHTSPEKSDAVNNSGGVPQSVGPSTTAHPRSRALHHRILAQARSILLSLLTPQAISIFTAFPIALITPLKALFTPVENSPIPNAPDGQPPLAFILDAATFIGAASVPLGLVCLGSALARLNVPRAQWGSLPLGAIGALAIGKMIFMPIIGVLLVQGLTTAGLIGEDDVVLRFVCIFLSCIPTATTQVFLTQVYSGTGEAAVLSAFLVPQYVLMFVTMTVLSAYTLSLLF